METSNERRIPAEPGTEKNDETFPLSRRAFIKVSSVVVIAGGVGAITAGCGANEEAPTAPPVPEQQEYTDVADISDLPPAMDGLHFFTPQEGETLEAITARIIPGDASDPGAREAGVVYFIDHMMTFHDGDDEATYRAGPFIKEYEVGKPQPTVDPAKDVLVLKDDAPRYGYQSSMTPAQEYRAGLAAVERYAMARFGKRFVALAEDQQDAILMDMAQGKATGFDKPSDESFFATLREHTLYGMFSDPGYGGNRNFVGWNLIAYPGAQRGWTPDEMRTEGFRRPPQSLAQLMPEAHGQGNGHGVLTVPSGTNNYPKLP